MKPRGLAGGSQAFEPPADETGALVVHNVPQPTMKRGLAELLQGPAFDLAHALPTEPSAPRGHPPRDSESHAYLRFDAAEPVEEWVPFMGPWAGPPIGKQNFAG